MSRVEALKSYTIIRRLSRLREKPQGMLAAGKLADVTVLLEDILTIPEDEIPRHRSPTPSSGEGRVQEAVDGYRLRAQGSLFSVPRPGSA